jgi:hypothetical protein
MRDIRPPRRRRSRLASTWTIDEADLLMERLAATLHGLPATKDMRDATD